MSAIAGIVNLDGRPVEALLIESMVDSLAHCGSDGRGVWTGASAALGHQALWTTPEASLGRLPREVAGRFVITADVRLDNRDDLLASLRGEGCISSSSPDCALVVAAYEKWGENCVEHFLGDFAFALWDIPKRKLFCARDHMGVRPFYYAFMPGQRFVFGTEIKAVLAVPGVPDTLNEQRIADGFAHVFNDHTTTYYSHVSRLQAAHCLTLNASVTMRRYWRLDPDRELRLNSDQEYADTFRGLFSQAVQCRLRSSHPIGSMLSGGLDSSAVACVARNWLRANGKPKLQTFSGVFDEVKQCDERPYIETVLEQGHCEPNFIVCDSLSPFSDADSITRHLDEPHSAGNMYLNWHAYRKAQEAGVRVILDGFDGDTTVSHGLARLAELAEAGKWRALATELRGSRESLNLDSWLDCWCSWFSRYNSAARSACRVWRGAARRLRPSKPNSLPSWDRINLLNPDLVKKLGLREIAREPRAPIKNERDRHFRLLERAIMPKLMELLNHSSAAFNVEVRFPFMDIRLIEYCLALPSDQKLRAGCTRFVMHNAMAGVLPDKIRQRAGKSNLAPSFEKGLVKFERDNFAAIILEDAGRLSAFVDLARIKSCLDSFQSGDASENEMNALWATAGLALWLRQRAPVSNNLSQKRKEVKKK